MAKNRIKKFLFLIPMSAAYFWIIKHKIKNIFGRKIMIKDLNAEQLRLRVSYDPETGEFR